MINLADRRTTSVNMKLTSSKKKNSIRTNRQIGNLTIAERLYYSLNNLFSFNNSVKILFKTFALKLKKTSKGGEAKSKQKTFLLLNLPSV